MATAVSCEVVVRNVAFLALMALMGLERTAAGASSATTPSVKARAAKGDESPKGLRTISASTAERIPLPRQVGKMAVETDALAKRIRITPEKRGQVPQLLKAVTAHLGVVCPRAAAKEGAVELRCRSGRFEAAVVVQGKDTFLDINELRGLPWRAGTDAPPVFFYDPWRIGLGQSCPGRTPGVRGECAFHEGKQLDAALQFRAALDTSARQLACVRLGDIAVATGDPVTGAGWYRRSGEYGIFGRVAAGRLCELEGGCLGTTSEVLHAFDPAGMPEPLRAETLMRAARAEAYMGRARSAVHVIAAQITAHGAASVCREGGELLCRRILLEGMQDMMSGDGGDGEGREAASAPRAASGRSGERHDDPTADDRTRMEEMLDAYMALPTWEKGPLAVELARAAAALAVRMGAPSFAGNLLASVAPEVRDADVSDHLLTAAEAFVRGENWPRARIVAEYAQTRAGKAGAGSSASGKGQGQGQQKDQKKRPRDRALAASLQSPRWKAVFRTLAIHDQRDELPEALRDAIEAELEASTAELTRVRQTMQKVESLLGVARVAGAEGAKEKAPPSADARAQPSSAAGDGTSTTAVPGVPHKSGAAKPAAGPGVSEGRS